MFCLYDNIETSMVVVVVVVVVAIVYGYIRFVRVWKPSLVSHYYSVYIYIYIERERERVRIIPICWNTSNKIDTEQTHNPIISKWREDSLVKVPVSRQNNNLQAVSNNSTLGAAFKKHSRCSNQGIRLKYDWKVGHPWGCSCQINI